MAENRLYQKCTVCRLPLVSAVEPAARQRHCMSPECTWCYACFVAKQRECGLVP